MQNKKQICECNVDIILPIQYIYEMEKRLIARKMKGNRR